MFTQWGTFNHRWNSKGVGIYVEDGNEMNNTISSNVVSCETHMYCRTDNHQDTGLYTLALSNKYLYNRVSNYHITIFAPSNGNGQGAAYGRVCPAHSPTQVFKGNVDYGGARFGLYVDNNSPRRLRRDSEGLLVDANGGPSRVSCHATNSVGQDNGQASYIEDHFVYGALFVGSYFLGDFQFKNLTSIDNNNGMYWKSSKNFGDRDAAHILDSTFVASGGGNAALGPSGSFTFVVENTRFIGNQGGMASGQHCGLASFNHGRHGSLCAAQYVYKNVSFAQVTSGGTKSYFAYGASGGNPTMPTLSQLDGDNSLELVASDFVEFPPFPSGPFVLVQEDPFLFESPESWGCGSVCTGSAPYYGCNSGFAFGVCLRGGGCAYPAWADARDSDTRDSDYYCCFKCTAQVVEFEAPVSAQYLKLRSLGEGGYGTSIYEFRVYEAGGNQTTIITATANVADGSHTADQAIDGNQGTRWSSNQGGQPPVNASWLVVGFAQPVQVARVEIVWEDARPSSFEIYAGSDFVATAPTSEPSAPPTSAPNTDAVATTLVAAELTGFANLTGCGLLPRGYGQSGSVMCPFAIRKFVIYTALDMGTITVRGPGYDGQTPTRSSPTFGQNAGEMQYDGVTGRGYAINLMAGGTYHLELPTSDVNMLFSDPVFGPGGYFPRHGDRVTLIINGMAPCQLSSQDCTSFVTESELWKHRTGFGGCAERLYQMSLQEDAWLAVASVASSTSQTNVQYAAEPSHVEGHWRHVDFPAISAINGRVSDNHKWHASASDESPSLTLTFDLPNALSSVDIWWSPLQPGSSWTSLDYAGPGPEATPFTLRGRVLSSDPWVVLATGSVTPAVDAPTYQRAPFAGRTVPVRQLQLTLPPATAVGVTEIRAKGAVSLADGWASLGGVAQHEGRGLSDTTVASAFDCMQACDGHPDCNSVVVCSGSTRCHAKDACHTAASQISLSGCVSYYRPSKNASTCGPPPPPPTQEPTSYPTVDTSVLGTAVTPTESTSAWQYQFDGCPTQLGGNRFEITRLGTMNLAGCQRACDVHPDCAAIEVRNCLRSPECLGACTVFRGDTRRGIANSGCDQSGNTKTFAKRLTPAVVEDGYGVAFAPAILQTIRLHWWRPYFNQVPDVLATGSVLDTPWDWNVGDRQSIEECRDAVVADANCNHKCFLWEPPKCGCTSSVAPRACSPAGIKRMYWSENIDVIAVKAEYGDPSRGGRGSFGLYARESPSSAYVWLSNHTWESTAAGVCPDLPPELDLINAARLYYSGGLKIQFDQLVQPRVHVVLCRTSLQMMPPPCPCPPCVRGQPHVPTSVSSPRTSTHIEVGVVSPACCCRLRGRPNRRRRRNAK